jgi:hypothetical protein
LIFLFCFFGGRNVWTQDHLLVRRCSTTWATLPALIASVILWVGSHFYVWAIILPEPLHQPSQWPSYLYFLCKLGWQACTPIRVFLFVVIASHYLPWLALNWDPSDLQVARLAG